MSARRIGALQYFLSPAPQDQPVRHSRSSDATNVEFGHVRRGPDEDLRLADSARPRLRLCFLLQPDWPTTPGHTLLRRSRSQVVQARAIRAGRGLMTLRARRSLQIPATRPQL